MANKSKYQRLEDLYVEGRELVLDEGLVIYLKAMNSLQAEEARSHAQAARSRIVLALRDPDSDEAARFDASMSVSTRDEIIRELAMLEVNMTLPKIMEEIRSDPDWSEKVEVIERHEDLADPSPEEEKVVAKINNEYLSAVREQLETDTMLEQKRLSQLDDDALRDRYMEVWVDRRGTDYALTEYRVTEVMYAARACEGVEDEGVWDHSECDSHRERIWPTRDEVRSLPEGLLERLADALDAMNVQAQQGKGLRSRGSSSGSSASTKKPEASTPSTPEGTSDELLTSSSQPSPTP